LLDLRGATTEDLVATAALVPGCRTRRLADAAFAALQRVPASWLEGLPEEDVATAFLWSADPQRTLDLLRRWARDDDSATRDFACRRLLRAADVASAPLIADWLARGGAKDVDPWDVPAALRVPALQKALGIDAWPGALSIDSESTETDQRMVLAAEPEACWDNYDYPREQWIRAELDRRWNDRGVASTPYVLMQLALWPDEAARRELWSIYRTGRYRWVVWRGDAYDLTLGRDLSTLPHWIDALESNCCVISGRVEGAFEEWFGIGWIYGSTQGIGQPPSERVLDWFALYGGDLVFCPMLGRFVARPD
jgi:hypothetical protein